MEKYYRISESELKGLLEDSLTLSMLDYDGVDNWEWYGESRSKIIKFYFPDAEGDDLYDLTFTDCVEIIMEDYDQLIQM